MSSGARLLLIDDEAPLLELLKKYLERLGYEVDACLSAEDALERFEADPSRYALVLTDLTLPVMNGEEMVERIGPVWGIGPDGELGNMFKRTPQQGLWFIAGGLAQCRINSKYLALQIKATELGRLGPL